MTDGTERVVPIHRVGLNHRERTPKRLMVFDTETSYQADTGGERHTLRLWHAGVWARGKDDGGLSLANEYSGTTTAELVSAINGVTRTRDCTWLYAHNLGFDLAVTWLPEALILDGWTLTLHALTADSPWARLVKGNKRIVLADSVSLFHVSAERLGQWQHTAKLPLPGNTDDTAALAARCRSDTLIVGEALRRLVAWWQAERMGSWSLTGAANGWHIMSHRFLTIRPVVVPGTLESDFERSAIMGGYHRITRTGILPGGPFAEIDIAHAYASIGWRVMLPSKRVARLPQGEMGLRWLDALGYDVIAHCRIKTERAYYPVRIGRRVWYTVGEFETVLCGPELRAARDAGELVAMGTGYIYRMAPWLRDFSAWVIDQLDSDALDGLPEARSFIKGISRSVYGRTALRVSRMAESRSTPVPGWSVEYGVDLDNGQRQTIMSLAGTVERWVQDGDGDNAMPAVLAYIESALRVEITRAVETLGAAAVQVNTDGIIVDLERVRQRWEDWYGPRLSGLDPYRSIADEVGARLTSRSAWGEYRSKRLGTALWLGSYQHLKLDKERHLSGVPRAAESVEHGLYRFYTWPNLRETLSHGDGRGYTRRERQVDLRRVAPLSWRLAGGGVEPARAYVGADGVTRLFGESPLAGGSGRLAPREDQHEELARLMIARESDGRRLTALAEAARYTN